MANTSQLQIVTQLTGDQYVITASVLPGGYLPQNIFLYQNTGTTTLGLYYGVCNTDELTRFQVWSGSAIPLFGNAFVRYNQAKIIVNVQQQATGIISNIQTGVQQLSTAMQLAANSSQIITIN